MKNRRTAILARRETEGAVQQAPLRSVGSPSLQQDANGSAGRPFRSVETSSPPTGFTAVNAARHSIGEAPKSAGLSADELFPSSGAGNVTYINGRSIKGASPTERAEMMKKFMSSGEREDIEPSSVRRPSASTSARPANMGQLTESRPRADSMDGMRVVRIPSTPQELMPPVFGKVADRDDGGPFKTEMVTRMETLQRYDRVKPPCDRCRRLEMDCLKNLTACLGCTKKHAKCSWKDVRPEELAEFEKSTEINRDHFRPEIDRNRDFRPDLSSPPMTVADVSRAVEESVRPPAAVPQAVAPPLERRDEGGDTVMQDTVHKEPTPPRPDPPLATEALRPASPKPAPVQVPAEVQPSPALPAAPLPAPPIQSRFDLKPPALVQGLQEAARQISPPRYPTYSTYPPREPPRPASHDDNDEGDRLQALAAQVYRSASQSVKPQESAS